MSALPSGAEDEIPGQDETHDRIRVLLRSATSALLQAQPGLLAFRAWHGLQTFCHVSALLAADGRPDPDPARSARLLEAVERSVLPHGLHRRSAEEAHGVRTATWAGPEGDLLELIVGVRVAVRAISGPFLPGSLDPVTTTSPVTALSPATPPARPAR